MAKKEVAITREESDQYNPAPVEEVKPDEDAAAVPHKTTTKKK